MNILMKKTILFVWSLSLLTACDYYTIQNDYIEDVIAGYVVINEGQCLEFFDFPFLGDFPLRFRYKDHQLMSESFYKPGHYKISKQGDILKQKHACELDPVRKKESLTQEEANPTKEDPEKTETDLKTEEETNHIGTDLKDKTDKTDSSSEDSSSSPNKKPDQDKTPIQNTKEVEIISV